MADKTKYASTEIKSAKVAESYKVAVTNIASDSVKKQGMAGNVVSNDELLMAKAMAGEDVVARSVLGRRVQVEEMGEDEISLAASLQETAALKAFLQKNADRDGIHERGNVKADQTMKYVVKIAAETIAMMNPNIHIVSNTNDHTSMIVKGVIHQESYNYVMGIDTMLDVQVCCGDNEDVIFWGVITSFDLQVGKAEEMELRELYIEAKSFTYLLDQTPRQRAFQNKQADYSDIIDVIINSNKNSNYLIAPEASSKSTNRFIVQYRETDWMFLKRIASQLGMPLIANNTMYGPKFSFGVIWKHNPYVLNEEEKSHIEMLHTAPSYSRDGYIKEQRSLRWLVDKPHEYMQIGDCVQFDSEIYYVKETDVEIIDHASVHRYTLSRKPGFEVVEYNNVHLTGLSLPGSVNEVKGNQVRPDLDIDVMDSDCWFTYATFYSTFYCMPEPGDRIYMYFPNDSEANAYILNSVRTSPAEGADGGLLITNPTADESEVKMASFDALSNGDATASMQSYDITSDVVNLANTEGTELVDMQISTSDETLSSVNPNPTASGSGGSRSRSGGSGGGGSSTPPQAQAYDFDAIAGNSSQKVLSTPDGKQVILNDGNGGITVMLDPSNFIAINGTEVAIVSSGKVTFSALGNISLKSKAMLTIAAESMLQIGCGETSAIVIDSDHVGIFSTDIKINE